MRILVVCGAGASSTFVAQRVRHAAQAEGLPYLAFAGTEQSLPIDLDSADMVLVGPHMAHAMDRIQHDADWRGAKIVLLPDDIFTDLDGTRTLALVRAAVAQDPDGEAVVEDPDGEAVVEDPDDAAAAASR
ncbi:PTS sugar transporter subunit IIB [Microbacterium sp. DT81.1]|uniref:PTS sugar transporter subunit IIB n=1 Tax=Microbacterium sp. DT81.1 TaxID=3393413 RepID=UPI003CF3725C